MLDFKRILVPYDGSEHGKRALKQAVAMAESSENTVLYIASIDEDVSALSVNNLERAYINEQLKAVNYSPAHKNLEEAKKTVPETVKAEYLKKTGDAGPLLEELAKENNCDLIVMGSRGLGALNSFLLGSVSNYMLTHAECPIFIIK